MPARPNATIHLPTVVLGSVPPLPPHRPTRQLVKARRPRPALRRAIRAPALVLSPARVRVITAPTVRTRRRPLATGAHWGFVGNGFGCGVTAGSRVFPPQVVL